MGELLLSQEHIKERKKRTQWVHPWIRERETYLKGHIFRSWMISGWRIKKILKSLFKQKLKLCVSTFYVLYKWTLFIKTFFTTHACFYFYVIEFKKWKNIFCTSEALLCFTQKNNFCIMNKIKLVFYHIPFENIFSMRIILYIFSECRCV